jgi:hypothetical protein
MARYDRSGSETFGDLVYDAFWIGAIGGSIVALFFLGIDLWNGQALFTPSLMGSVLFLGDAAETVSDVRLDMVSAFTVAHYAAFSLLGIAIAVLVHELELHSKHPLITGIAIFLLAEIGFFGAAALFMPGVVDVVGAGWIGAANLLAAAGVALFLLSSHRPDLWFRLKHAMHLA